VDDNGLADPAEAMAGNLHQIPPKKRKDMTQGAIFANPALCGFIAKENPIGKQQSEEKFRVYVMATEHHIHY
jgi:hypothetical protein